MTNLKAGSGPTCEPVQGPQICLILGHLCWSSNRRSVDPEPSLKGLRSAERSVFFKKRGPELTLYEGSDVVPHPAVQHIYIYILCSPLSEGVDTHTHTHTHTYIYIYIYIYMAKALFSTYLLGNCLLKAGEKVHFSTKKRHDQLWSSFLFSPFCLRMAKICCFCLSKGQKGGQNSRPPPYIYIYRSYYLGQVWPF